MISESVLGKQITDVTIVTEEHDSADKWVSAGISVRVSMLAAKAARFSLELVTKEHYLTLELKRNMDELDNPERLLVDEATVGEQLETRAPYVLNDAELSEDVINGKFIGRVIEADLLASLWPLSDEV